MVVLDASVALAWCFEDEASDVTDRLLDRVARGGAVVPDLWSLEIANVLLVARRRGRVTEAGGRGFLAMLERLAIERVAAPTADEPLTLGVSHDLTAYDAAYLHLAMSRGLPLATLDARLAEAARSAGVDLALESG